MERQRSTSNIQIKKMEKWLNRMDQNFASRKQLIAEKDQYTDRRNEKMIEIINQYREMKENIEELEEKNSVLERQCLIIESEKNSLIDAN